MEVLTGATGITVDRSHFSNVGRDQYNNCTLHQGAIVEKRVKVHRGLPELAEYTEVKRGDIFKQGDIYNHGNVCYSWRLCSNGKDDTEATVYTAQVMISGRFGDSKFTVKTYHGRNGKKEWQRDFQRCSRDWKGDIPLFGYNKSLVPSLIFHGELVPIAHIEAQVGLVGQMYFEILSQALRCSKNEIWMDPAKGSFCRGPVGPKCIEWFDDHDNVEIPSDAEFLKEDVLTRYLSSIKYDRGLLFALHYTGHRELLKEVPSVCYNHVISSTTNSTIAFNRNVQWWIPKGCLCFSGMTADGLTRFFLTDHGRHIQIRSLIEADPWLSQALSIFNTLNVQFDEDLSNFKFLSPFFILKGTLQSSKSKHQRRLLVWPIYLFLLPCPSPGIHFYFWSHDPSGNNPFPPDMCRYFGLPITLSIVLKYYCISWPTKVYKTLHSYQVARGFNATTTDFGKSRGYPLFEVFSPENCFHKVDDKEAKNTFDSDQTNEDDGQVHSSSTKPEQMATDSSLLSTLHEGPMPSNMADDGLLEDQNDDIHYSLTTLFNRDCAKEFTLIPCSSSYLQTNMSVGYLSPISQSLEIPHIYPLFGQLTRRIDESSGVLSTDLEALSDVD